MNSIKLQGRMDTIFMNSGNSKTSDPHRLLLKLLDKINLMNHILYQIFKIILDHLKKNMMQLLIILQ